MSGVMSEVNVAVSEGIVSQLFRKKSKQKATKTNMNKMLAVFFRFKAHLVSMPVYGESLSEKLNGHFF